MTVPASPGVFSWAPQAAKGTLGDTWFRHKASRVNVGPQQTIQQFPPEIGGGIHPTGAFKSAAFVAGQAVMQPRLDEVIGWLMYAACGKCSDIADTPETDMHRHRFTPPAAYYDMPWLSVRREIPGATGSSDNVGDIGLDCRCVGMRFAVAPGGILQSAWTFVGRVPTLSETGVDTWSYDNTYEEYPSVPLASQGAIELGGVEKPAVNVVVDLVNAYTSPREEMIIGSPYPDDFILQGQTLSITWTYKWQNAALYKALLTGDNVEGDGEIDWSPTPYTASMKLSLESPGYATGMSNPWRLEVYAPTFCWQAAGPPELIGGGWLSLAFTGIAQETTGVDTFYVDLENLIEAYTWPS
jgi:hypothetical protein